MALIDGRHGSARVFSDYVAAVVHSTAKKVALR